jgi:hypothetical protein
MPMDGHVRACSRSTAQKRVTTTVGLEPGSEEGLDGTIGFDGEHSCDATSARDRFAHGCRSVLVLAAYRVPCPQPAADVAVGFAQNGKPAARWC